jgi:SAM-dependent methyltransferase
MNILRYHEIAEGSRRILNPFTEVKLMRLGEICQLGSGMRQLDLACGKGEMLCRWADVFGITGTGIDISPVFLGAARQRADELGVVDRVAFVEADASTYAPDPHSYDIVSCIGATWIGGGTVGAINLMKNALKDATESLLLVGEVYWKSLPPDEALQAMDIDPDDWPVGLDGMLARFEEASVSLLQMIVAAPEDWDDYEANHWITIDRYLRTHPDDPDAAALQERMAVERRDYMHYLRPHCGWGVFVLRASGGQRLPE